MKHIYFIITILLISNFASAQYEKGGVDFSFSGGFGIYSGKSNYDNDTSTGPAAASSLLNATVNYSILEKVSAGIEYDRNKFLTNDSIGTAYGFSNNFRLNVLYRLVNAEKSCFYVKGGVGFSKFKFGDTSNATYVKSSGLNYEFKIAYELYLHKNVGLFMNTGWAGYNYKELRDQDGELWKVSSNGPAATLLLSGVNVRLGITVRL